MKSPRSFELFEEQSAKLLSVGELAAAAEVPERTLQTAFKERYGGGPAQCLFMVRSGRLDLLFHGSEQRVHRPRFSKRPIHIGDL